MVSLGAAAVLAPACGGLYPQEPTCGAKNTSALILTAQAVPSATLVPCIAEFPSGWSYDGSRIGSGSAQFFLNSDRAGFHALEITLTEACDVSNAIEVTAAGGVPGVRVYEEPISLPRPSGSTGTSGSPAGVSPTSSGSPPARRRRSRSRLSRPCRSSPAPCW